LNIGFCQLGSARRTSIVPLNLVRLFDLRRSLNY
jgi:hypothetical protein